MKRALWKLIRGYIYCILAILCLCMAGSDGDYFPWVNVVGTLILVIMAWIHLRHGRRSDILSRVVIFLDGRLDRIHGLKR